jgi:hypothetical protein
MKSVILILLSLSFTGCATTGQRANPAAMYQAMAAMRGLATPDKPIYWNPGAPMRPQVNYYTPAAAPACNPNNPYCGDPQNVSW